MCVIFIADEKRLTGRMIQRASVKNPDGIGMGWHEEGGSRYVKGITVKKAIELSKSLPMPYVFHARYATKGDVQAELCHPFPVTDRRADRTSGRCPRILFHNGTWKDSQETLKRIEQRFGVRCPEGPMSDTRAMAFVVAVAGEGVLDMEHGQRFALLDGSGVHRYGSGWVKWNGFWCSNVRWLPKKKSKGSTLFTGKLRGAGTKPPPMPSVEPPAEEAGPLGFYTVPSESGSAMLVKARSTSEAFQIANGHAPGWRRRMAASEDAEKEIQTLENWMGDDRHAKAWRRPLEVVDVGEDVQ